MKKAKLKELLKKRREVKETLYYYTRIKEIEEITYLDEKLFEGEEHE